MAARQFETEEDFVAWLQSKAPAIGDDAAFVEPLNQTAITVDSQREGVHFLPGTPAAVIARRLLAVNLSDLAAVGAEPHHAVCTLAAPSGFDRRAFFNALLEQCEKFDISLVGGDLSRAPSIECTLTAVGTRARRGRFLQRSSAQVGDHVWLAGSLGESALGLRVLKAGALWRGNAISLPSRIPRTLRRYARHCVFTHTQPEPMLLTGQWLARRKSDIAAIDISDGLLKDARRLAAHSDVGIRLEFEPIKSTTDHSQFRQLCAVLDCDPTALQLTGGEDYALLFTVSPQLSRKTDRHRHTQSKASPLPVTEIGTVVGERQGVSVNGVSEHTNYTDSGWDHLAAESVTPQ